MTAGDWMVVIARAVAGDSNALEILLSQCDARVFKIALGITKHWQDAEDVVQETLLRMCTKIDQFRGESQFATWLSRVAINQAITCQRKRTRSKVVSLDSTSETDDRCFLLEPPDRRPDPEQQFRHAESAKCLGAALRRLPPSIRKLFLLHHLYDVPIHEAANQLGSLPALQRADWSVHVDFSVSASYKAIQISTKLTQQYAPPVRLRKCR
jgi:RNA polymerase sigma-70 factor (ECF subfamily)